jgi:hypothetical protein
MIPNQNTRPSPDVVTIKEERLFLPDTSSSRYAVRDFPEFVDDP